MSRKKNKDFSNNPFKRLKGLSVSREPSSPPQEEKTGPKAGINATPVEEDTFSAEMAWLGVEPINEGVPSSAEGDSQGDKVSGQSASEQPPQDDQALFLESVGRLDTDFRDEWPEDEPQQQARPRRMKQVEKGQLQPQAELDLHGMTREEALAKLGYFLENAGYQGWTTVLVITGKGVHSPDGPVLRQAVEHFLSRNGERVLEWGVAPRRYGGTGALVVFLRG